MVENLGKFFWFMPDLQKDQNCMQLRRPFFKHGTASKHAEFLKCLPQAPTGLEIDAPDPKNPKKNHPRKDSALISCSA